MSRMKNAKKVRQPEAPARGQVVVFVTLLLILFSNQVFPQGPPENASEVEAQAKQLSQTWGGDTYRRSISLYEKASRQWISLNEFERSSRCLREAARLYLILAELENASDLLKQAYKIAERNNLINEKIHIFSQRSLAALSAGRVKESETHYRQAIQLGKLTPDPFPNAAAFYSAGVHNYSYGDAGQTSTLFQQALSRAEKAGEKDLTTQIRMHLGFAFVRMGDPVAALRETSAALSIWQENEDERGKAISSLGVGFVYSVMDEKQKALEFYEKANRAFPEDIDWTEKAKACNGIATIYEEYGELGLAENYRREALTLYQKANYPYGALATLPSLAELSYLKGNKSLALRLYGEALVLAIKLDDAFHRAVIKEGLGNMDLDSGSYNDAIRNYREALLTYEKIKIKLPRIRGLLGKAFEKKGDIKLARRYYESALKVNREIKDKFAEGQTLYDLARLDSMEKRDESALRLARESVVIGESFSSDVLNSRVKSTYFSSIYNRYELYIELLMRMANRLGDKDYEILALQASEKARARSMLETLRLSGSHFTKDAKPEFVQREKEITVTLNLKADMVTDVLSSGTDASKVESLSGEMNVLYHELEEIKAVLKRDSPIYSAIKDPPSFDLAEFQDRVLDDTTVVLVFSLGHSVSFLWLIDKAEVKGLALPPREQIESRVQELRRLLASREIKQDESADEYRTRLIESEDTYWFKAQLLSNDLFGQIADKLEEKRLIVVPDGKLHYFPFSALPRPNAGDRVPILESNETVYEPSASALLLLMTQEKRSPVPTKNLLVFTDPIFSSQDSRLSSKEEGNPTVDSFPATSEIFRSVESLRFLPRLVASKIEGESIAEIVGTSGSTVMTGFSATREQVLSHGISDYKIIHFATHGLINEERPELSGIVLSRFDENGRPRNEFVRLQDIYGLDLSADLVVLSACDTGIGKEVKGEGVMNLTNSFMKVGARSVVSTLWKVDDNATVELMKNFYESLAKENATPSKALRDAQIKLSKNSIYNSPFYWAAFTVQGDFRHATNLAPDSSYPSYFMIIFSAFLIFAGYKLWRHRKAKKQF